MPGDWDGRQSVRSYNQWGSELARTNLSTALRYLLIVPTTFTEVSSSLRVGLTVVVVQDR